MRRGLHAARIACGGLRWLLEPIDPGFYEGAKGTVKADIEDEEFEGEEKGTQLIGYEQKVPDSENLVIYASGGGERHRKHAQEEEYSWELLVNMEVEVFDDSSPMMREHVYDFKIVDDSLKGIMRMLHALVALCAALGWFICVMMNFIAT
eukprot:12681861-Alexandrium_andersonii.AAC.1